MQWAQKWLSKGSRAEVTGKIKTGSCGNAIFFSANRLQYASNATKLSVSTQLFDRALLNRNGVMDIWNMAHVEDGGKYYIRKEYTEVMTKALEQAIIDGNGTGKPKGILAETPADGQTIESAAPSYSDLIKAEGALPIPLSLLW